MAASLIDQIGQLRTHFIKELQDAANSKDLENLKVKYLGKKGPIQSLMMELKNCTTEERPHFGKLINDLKEELVSHCENSLARLKNQEMVDRFEKEWLDPTLPGRRGPLGREHPVTQMLNHALDILIGMGFSVRLGPDVDTDYYNFGGLNFAKDHPARDMQDTFYLSTKWLLRTHTSNTQVHTMENFSPPIRVVAPGRCFRNETTSARSHVFFHQVEAFYIDKHVTFADLFSTMDEFWSKLLGEKVKTRFRPSYFPFTEPGLEVDVLCTRCKGSGCRICKHTGWLEVCGAGMIHPNVLRKGGIDPEVYSGFAWGMGIERPAILKHQIPDIRYFTQNDMKFLTQFA
ncbi:MAG: phenylalanine--tRNA ligase subunit alpha [Verrucomicrobia bacterium]|nr:phenylalanine--tRNA ligase subunit alpha [Verrucomicrobiota bacterium]